MDGCPLVPLPFPLLPKNIEKQGSFQLPQPKSTSMENQATYPVGGSHQYQSTTTGTPQSVAEHFRQIPAAEHTLESLLDASAAGTVTQSDPMQSSSEVNAGIIESGSGLGWEYSPSLNWSAWANEADDLLPPYNNKLHDRSVMTNAEPPIGSACANEADDLWAPYNNKLRLHDLSVMTNAEPPIGSTDAEFIHFLHEQMDTFKQQQAIEVNHSQAEADGACPTEAMRYVTSLRLQSGSPDPDGFYGYWKEKECKPIRKESRRSSLPIGIKRTFQFYSSDGTKTSWFANEYIPTGRWGNDMFLQDTNFREIFNSATKAPGEPTSPRARVQTKKRKTTAVKKHRMRGPNDPRVVKPESPAWQHFIKVYDRHPERDGSKVLYAVCCCCDTVLRAGTENGTKSLHTHLKENCKSKHLQQQHYYADTIE